MFYDDDETTIDNSWMTPQVDDETSSTPEETPDYNNPVVEETPLEYVSNDTAVVEEIPVVEETSTEYVPDATTVVEETPAEYIPDATAVIEETPVEYVPSTTEEYVEQNTVQSYDNTGADYDSETTPAVDNNLENYYNSGQDDFSFEDPIKPKQERDYKIWFILGGVAIGLLLLFYLPKMFSSKKNTRDIPLFPDIVGERVLLDEKTEEFDNLKMTRYIYTGMENGNVDSVTYWDALEKKYGFRMRYSRIKLIDTDSNSYQYSEVTKQTGDDGSGAYVGILSRQKEVFVIIAKFQDYKDLPMGPYFFAYMSDAANYKMSMDDFENTRFNSEAFKDSPAYAILENANAPIVAIDETPLPTIEAPVVTEPPVENIGPVFTDYHMWFTTLIPDTTIDKAKEILQTEPTQNENQYTFTYGEDKIILTYSDGILVSKILNYGQDMNDMKMVGVTADKLNKAKASAKGKLYDEVRNVVGVHAYLISQTFSPEYSLTNMWVAEDGTTLTCKYDNSGKCVSVE